MAVIFCSLLLFHGASALDAAGAPVLAGKRVAIRTAETCPSDPDPLGLVSNDFYSDCGQAELNKVKGWIAASLAANGVFGSVGDDNPDLLLTVTMTQVEADEGVAGMFTDLAPATMKFTAAYHLADTAGRVLKSGTMHHEAEEAYFGGNEDVEEQVFSEKIAAAAATPADTTAAAANGAGRLANTPPSGSAAGQLDDAVAQQNYRDLVATAYRSLQTKPPIPADAFAVALAKTNQLASAIIEGRMYLRLVPNAPDAQSMPELVAEWGKAAPPPNLPSGFPMPPGLPGWGFEVTDTPDIVTSAMGQANAKGVLALLILTSSPVQAAGLEVGEVIVCVKSDVIASPENLRAIISMLPPKTIAQAVILRGGKQITIECAVRQRRYCNRAHTKNVRVI